MKTFVMTVVAAGTLTAQTVGGPVLGYVVDATSRMHPVFGMPSAAHIGSAVRDNVRNSWGNLALLADGTAMRNGVALEGTWASLQPGAFVDASGHELLIAGETVAPWRLTLPDSVLSVQVSTSGERVLTLLSDESLAAWTSSGKAEFRMAVSKWWSIAFAGERAIAYDPSAHALLWLDGPGGTSLARKLDGEGARYILAADRNARHAVLLGAQALVIPLNGDDMISLTPPDGADRLEPLQGGTAFLLTRDTTRPLWVLDPSAPEAFLTIPALAEEKGGPQ